MVGVTPSVVAPGQPFSLELHGVGFPFRKALSEDVGPRQRIKFVAAGDDCAAQARRGISCWMNWRAERPCLRALCERMCAHLQSCTPPASLVSATEARCEVPALVSGVGCTKTRSKADTAHGMRRKEARASRRAAGGP